MDIIKTNKPKLIRWLRGDELFLQNVESRNLITKDEYDMVNSIPDPSQKIIKILDLMVRKGDGICRAFLEMLKDNEVNESSPELRAWIATVNTSSSASSSSSSIPDSEEFLRKNRNNLIQRVKDVTEIVDQLNFRSEMMANVQAQPTEPMKMRKVLDYTNSRTARERLIEVLMKHDPDLMEELTSN
ncbi:apoptosis-associated speck-like protein containing a CARD [Trichomycterus rosablanca]|uniref:apoptosis-associated speck-like protein containing a CARD n=1 Tax=Trichomycterus rosablanca TaxID=2290929 RepID=UPI002F34F7ED